MGFRYELLPRQDDFAVIQQFNQLYMKVRAWSIEFLGGIKDSEIAPEVLQRLERTIFGGTATCRGSSASDPGSAPSPPYLSPPRSPSHSPSRSPLQSSPRSPSRSPLQSSRSPSRSPSWQHLAPLSPPRSSSRSPSRPSRKSVRSQSPAPLAAPRHDICEILRKKTLHRHAVESLVGVTISEMLNMRGDPDLDVLTNTLYDTVTGFAVPRAPCNREQLHQELRNILDMAWKLSVMFKLQQSANFVVSYPKVVPGQEMVYNPDIMEDKTRRGCDEWNCDERSGRRVGMLLFPGLFKNANRVRTCMVKIKVVCTDEMSTPPVFRQVNYH